jgi:hypothetical protein
LGNIDEDNQSSYKFKFRNNSSFPIELIEIFSPNKTIHSFTDSKILPKQEIFLPVKSIPNLSVHDINFSYKIHGINNQTRIAIVIPKSFTTGISLPELWNSSNEGIANSSDLVIDRAKKSIIFNKNLVTIESNLHIPKNFVLLGHPGLTINLLKGASIFSDSAMKFIGSKNDPIIVTSTDQDGGGIFIANSKTKSIFINTIFRNISSPDIKSSGLTGGITIYNSDVYFEGCTFTKNSSEDFLNLVHSKYRIFNSDFDSVLSDAVDSDYSIGTIENSRFTRIGNDAMDFSGSESRILEITIDGVGDKGISAGEMSKVSGEFISIANAEIGITSKDLSEVSLDNVQIEETKVGFVAFQKKEEYGPGKIKIEGLTIKNLDVNQLVGPNSSIVLDGKSVTSERSEVKSLLYGVEYGKDSH